MTGAAACLTGFDGLAVVIHGSSGCYYYPATLLHRPLHCSFLIESDLVMGGEERLRDVVRELPHGSGRIAVIVSCTPSITGEDVKACLAEYDPLVVDSPGFLGGAEEGFALALDCVKPAVDPDHHGVNIDGVNRMDPFARGNVHELKRLLALIGAQPATVFCMDTIEHAYSAAPRTLVTNPDFAGAPGRNLGATLGLDATGRAFTALCDGEPGLDPVPLEDELRNAEEGLVKACDRFLQRYDPPRVLIFGTSGYAFFAAETLHRYLDAAILAIGTRTDPEGMRYPAEKVTALSRVREMVAEHNPDLIIGSSFERAIASSAAFVGIIPPLRGRVRLSADPICGVEGTLSFMESVLNSCIDHRR
jgi:nitrogenase molybdenum-iron protein alpha/beta subunit